MNIENNIIKHYLRNVLFITGTAYAGKSTMCKMLAERYDLIHCEENYNSETIFSIVDQKHQPNLNYFNTKKDWEEYVSRSPDEFERWINGNNQEIAGFEIAELIKISQNRKVIVDTNIPIELLKEITDYHQVAIMLSQLGMASANFFNRDDPEKLFLKKQIEDSSDPDWTMANFQACVDRINSKKYFDMFVNSGCFVIIRESLEIDNREQVLTKIATHFKLS